MPQFDIKRIIYNRKQKGNSKILFFPLLALQICNSSAVLKNGSFLAWYFVNTQCTHVFVHFPR